MATDSTSVSKAKRVFNYVLAFLVGAVAAGGAVFVYGQIHEREKVETLQEDVTAWKEKHDKLEGKLSGLELRLKQYSRLLDLEDAVSDMNEGLNELAALNFGSARDELVAAKSKLAPSEHDAKPLEIAEIRKSLPQDKVVVAEDVGPQVAHVKMLRARLNNIIASRRQEIENK